MVEQLSFNTPEDSNGKPQKSEGDLLKEAGIDAVLSHNPHFRTLLTAEATRVLMTTGHVCADDVRHVRRPEHCHHNVVGGVFNSMHKKGVTEPDGFVKSKAPSAHSRPIQRWKLKQPPTNPSENQQSA